MSSCFEMRNNGILDKCYVIHQCCNYTQRLTYYNCHAFDAFAMLHCYRHAKKKTHCCCCCVTATLAFYGIQLLGSKLQFWIYEKDVKSVHALNVEI